MMHKTGILSFIILLSLNIIPLTSEQLELQLSNVGAGIASLNAGGSEQKQGRNSSSDDVSRSRRNAITNAIEICSPAIVGINVTEVVQVDPFFSNFQNDPFFSQFFGMRDRSAFTRQYEVRELGSGYIISDDGYILTNHHVAGNAQKIIVTTMGGKKYDAEIIGSDRVSDVALLKIDAKHLPYLKLGNSDDAIIGEWAIAFGNPFGLFDLNAKPTVTVGVVSNVGVSFFQDNRVYKNMIQTDAAISSGNSGGPLINSAGEVMGMNTVIFSTAQNNQGAGSIGIGFAIPINRVKDIVKLLKEDKQVDRNFSFGIDVRNIDKRVSQYFKLSRTEGVVAISIERGSSAEDAGIEPGDIILKINDKEILTIEDLQMVVNDCITGDKLKFVVLRDDKETDIKLTLKPKRK
jgi:serine protease Do